jgi:TrwC relaxase
MFEGRHPDTGELLGRPHGRNAVPAFDVVLRPTKSVSILYGLGDPATGRAVLAAPHAGVREAVGYLDEHIGTRRGHGGVQHVSGQGVLAAGFDHRTSREGDPPVDVAEQVQLGLLSGAVAGAVDPFHLQDREKFSARALSSESPAEPIDGRMPASSSRWVNRIAVYCPGSRGRRNTALVDRP